MTETTNNAPDAVAKYSDDGRAVVVRDPFAPERYHADPMAIIKSMNARKKERKAQFDALGDIADAPLEAVKTLHNATEEDDDALLDFEKRLKDALLDLSGFKAVVVQMRGTKSRIDPASVRGKFAEIVKACKERIDAEKPPEPTHNYVVRMTCTDKALAAVMKAAQRAGCSDLYTAAAQGDKATRAIDKWFEENKIA
jgi:hypothetical protein